MLAVPVPEPGTNPAVLLLALEAGMPIHSGPVPPRPLITPSMVMV